MDSESICKLIGFYLATKVFKVRNYAQVIRSYKLKCYKGQALVSQVKINIKK